MSHISAGNNLFCESSRDRSITALHLLQLNVEHSPNHPLWTFVREGVVKEITWKEFGAAVDFSAHFVLKTISKGSENTTPPVIATLAACDGITHFTFGYGILRAGHPAFLISTRNSPVAIAHLLHETNCHDLFVSGDAAMQAASAEAAAILAVRGYSLSIHRMPVYEDIYGEGNLKFEIPPLPENVDLESISFILHSSGSTAFPKPVRVSHRVLMYWIRHPEFADGDSSKDVMGVHALPMFHAMGLIVASWPFSTGMKLACFPPVFPPIQPTPDAVLQSMKGTSSTLVFSVPSVVEHWTEKPENLGYLARLRGIMFAGAPLNTAVGNLLAKNKVPMIHMYGSTEIGAGAVFIPKKPQLEDWAYLRLPSYQSYMLIPCDDEGHHELVYLENENHRPNVFNTEIDGKPAYATSDLLVQHPTNPNMWKIYGRKDDQLILSTGEKTNPVPIGNAHLNSLEPLLTKGVSPNSETTLCRDPRISFAIMFGRGKEINGVIVQPPPEYAFAASDTEALAKFRNDIWPTVEKANAVAPSHSRLFKEMIIVANPHKPFDLTAKGTARRQFVIVAYQEEIDRAYEAVRESSQSDFSPPSQWGISDILVFTREVVHKTLQVTLGDDEDLFQRGCDSLQATWIRNTVRHALKQSSKRPVHDISQNFVYDNPSISSLATYIHNLVSSPLDSSTSRVGDNIKLMEDMVSELSEKFLLHQPFVPSQSGDVVLVTGTTGALGSYLLAQLTALPEILRIYVINRPAKDNTTIQERQGTAFADRDLDGSLLSSSKLVFLQTDIALPRLGLTTSIYDGIRKSVTHIIHNAWRVDFKISLPSFKSSLQGVRNLINLALGSPLPSPPALIFTSSVGVLRNWNSSDLVPEAPVDAKVATGSGYPESKWVAEMILHKAAQSTPLRPTVVRIDQLSGSKSGAWNHTDSIPAIVRSGQILGCLPDRKDHITWLPVDIAAASIIDIRSSRIPYIHLRSPRQVLWHDVFQEFSTQLGINLVPYDEWLSILSKQNDLIESGAITSQEKDAKNPALLLLDFYKSIREEKGPTTALMDISQTLQACRPLQEAEFGSVLLEEDVKKWICYWRSKGLLEG